MLRNAIFIPAGSDGHRFALVCEPVGEPRGVLVYVHPFAEEMNKSRRMASLAARAFAEGGWAVLQLDLAGCGDSSDGFESATWNRWVEDVSLAVAWCRERFSGPLCLWGLRGGCLLIAEWLGISREHHPLLLWQPVLNGKHHLTQFLRLKAASEMLSETDSQNVMRDLRSRLAAGLEVEVGGYALSPGLTRGLTGATLDLTVGYSAKVAVLEVSSSESGSLSPATGAAATKWAASGTTIVTEVVQGPAFWSTQDIETVPALIDASRRVLAGIAA